MNSTSYKMKLTAALSTLVVAMTLTAMAESNLQSIPLKDIDGKDTSLKAYDGKVLLVVNVASKCGLTPQYEQLEATQLKYKNKGFAVLGFPCNDFAGQEPGTNEQIKKFCTANCKVTFPMFDKLHVKGSNQHPLYTELTAKDSKFPGDVSWNFGKFLISRDGKLIARFEPATTPDSAEITKAIESALASK